jgi:phenylpyruvate tautomerase PptA (4-oxalocrotonate tautomerase family)
VPTSLIYRVVTVNLPGIALEVQSKESSMPVYSCSTPLALSPELKGAIAKEFTRIHREFTGAPEPFVNIVFLDLPHGSHYLGSAVRENGTLINAIVRAGRTLETRQALLKSLSAAWSSLTGQQERKLVIRVEEADAETIMEAGLIMPRPGEEAAWMAANKETLGELAA